MKKLWRVLKLVQSLNPWAIFHVFMAQIFLLSKPYLFLFFSAKIVDQLIVGAPQTEVMTTLLYFLVTQFLVSALYNIFKRLNDISLSAVEFQLADSLTKKALVMDYASLSDPENRLRFQRAEEGSNFSGGILTFIRHIMSIGFGLIISLVVAGVALAHLALMKSSLDTPLAQFTNSPLFIVSFCILILVPVMVSIYANKKTAAMNLKNFEHITHTNREFSYYASTMFSDNEAGKTIRLYDALPMIMKVFVDASSNLIDSMISLTYQSLPYNGLSQSVSLIATAGLLLLVGSKSIVGVIGIGSVLMYTGYVQTLINNLVKGLGELTFAQNIVNYLQYYIDFLDLPEGSSGTQHVDPSIEPVFTFENVSFKYPNADTYVLKNITTTINPKEHLAIVGQNGAGKTTFIKLLCKLYTPTEGRILLNGVDIQDIDKTSYTDVLSVVFQDYYLYPFEIKDNVVLGKPFDSKRAQEALEVTGVWNKVSKLPKGINTSIKGQLDEGVRLSGGESQKVAIARAWYKNTPLVILDEPTAALDPISEFEIYKNFNALMDEKTAIYVSHRMSSCKFCDRVLVFDKGEIIQDGHHDILMKDTDNLYSRLFNAQAQYYVNS